MAVAGQTWAKAAYGALFVVVLPVLLAAWARGSAGVVKLPAYGNAWVGWGAAAVGVLLMAGGMWQLWKQGGGLPMNAFPPERLVTAGLYRWVSHPIYTGFTAACWGVSMATGSASGLWLVTPMAALGCAALVMGYEGVDLEARFGAERVVRLLAADREERAGWAERVRVIWVVTLPWVVLSWAAGGGVSPIWLLALAPLAVGQKRVLRRFTIQGWLAMAVGLPLMWPSPWWVSAGLLPYGWMWEGARRAAERVANSWKEWRFGPVRLINHGLWVGLGTCVGLVLITAATGPRLAGAVLATTLAGVAGAGLWAQWVEGSPRLLRPFGFYGGLLGVTVACLAFDEVWLLWGAYSLAGPWVQAFGRLRCLVQGCCHGGPARAGVGIVYRRDESRVSRIAHLKGVPVHATQLYSILWNVATGLALGRLWAGGAALSLIAGGWLMLNGVGRFVEEAYRGEPQTAKAGGLHLYQWLAMVSVAAGAAVTCAGGGNAAPALRWADVSWWVAGAGFAATTFAMGVDFPASGRRFARLTQG